MDTTENELQALRKEIGELRTEMVSLHKELLNNQKVIIRIINHPGINISLNNFVGAQTAELVLNEMNKVAIFNDKKKYFNYLLTNWINKSEEGQYLEFGVYKGNSINFISATLPDKIIYGFDSFEGLPEIWKADVDKGHFNIGGNLPPVNKNVRLIKGWFNETLPEFVKEHTEPCAFIHVDCDLYSSTKTIFENLKNQIVSGTVIAFDEYFNYPGWQEGEYKAFMEFIAWSGLEFEYIARTESQQAAVKIK